MGGNQMPFNILDLVERDETPATCQIFNAEVCYGSGLGLDTCVAAPKVKSEIEDSLLDNDLAAHGSDEPRPVSRSGSNQHDMLYYDAYPVYSAHVAYNCPCCPPI